ncbi:hypothetical protein M8J77_006017 [Diaphorina citri]|nr:hypothetical protein M8J77_006017 [Diaphorina citri]
MFADDSCIVACHKDVETAVKIAQNDFVNLQKYLYNNHIYLNERKNERTKSKKLRILKYKLIKINAGNLPLTTKRTIYFSLIDSLLRYGTTLYTLAPQYVLDPLTTQQRKIKNILFNQIDVSCLTPDELAIFVLISLNFHEEKYRQLRDQPYALRTQRFRRPHVYTIQYGERRLEYIIPTLLNTYCQEFIDETNKDLVKTKIKKSILSKRS